MICSVLKGLLKIGNKDVSSDSKNRLLDAFACWFGNDELSFLYGNEVSHTMVCIRRDIQKSSRRERR